MAACCGAVSVKIKAHSQPCEKFLSIIFFLSVCQNLSLTPLNSLQKIKNRSLSQMPIQLIRSSADNFQRLKSNKLSKGNVLSGRRCHTYMSYISRSFWGCGKKHLGPLLHCSLVTDGIFAPWFSLRGDACSVAFFPFLSFSLSDCSTFSP